MGEMLLVALALTASVWGVTEAVHGSKKLFHHVKPAITRVMHPKKGK